MGHPGRFLIILNPSANRGGAARAAPLIHRLCRERQLAYELHTLTGKERLDNLSRQAARDGFTVVAAAGGDGTVNGVVNGLMQAQESGITSPRLAILRLGRHNRFATALPEALEACVALMASGVRTSLDVGCLKTTPTARGFYFCGRVTLSLGHTSANAGRHAPAPFRLIHDRGVLEIRSQALAIFNGKNLDDCRDSCLDLSVSPHTGKSLLETLRNRLFKVENLRLDEDATRSGRFELSTDLGALSVTADGEKLDWTSRQAVIECLPSRLSLICSQ